MEGEVGLWTRRGRLLQVRGGKWCSTWEAISSTLGEKGFASLVGLVARWVLAKCAEAAWKVGNSREHSEHTVGVWVSKVLWTFLAWVLKTGRVALLTVADWTREAILREPDCAA